MFTSSTLIHWPFFFHKKPSLSMPYYQWSYTWWQIPHNNSPFQTSYLLWIPRLRSSHVVSLALTPTMWAPTCFYLFWQLPEQIFLGKLSDHSLPTHFFHCLTLSYIPLRGMERGLGRRTLWRGILRLDIENLQCFKNLFVLVNVIANSLQFRFVANVNFLF